MQTQLPIPGWEPPKQKESSKVGTIFNQAILPLKNALGMMTAFALLGRASGCNEMKESSATEAFFQNGTSALRVLYWEAKISLSWLNQSLASCGFGMGDGQGVGVWDKVRSCVCEGKTTWSDGEVILHQTGSQLDLYGRNITSIQESCIVEALSSACPSNKPDIVTQVLIAASLTFIVGFGLWKCGGVIARKCANQNGVNNPGGDVNIGYREVEEGENV